MKRLSNNEAIERLSKNNNKVIFISEYYNTRKKSKFKCSICGENHNVLSYSNLSIYVIMTA